VPAGLTLLLLAVFGLAVAFDYVNGFHDTANAIATSVSTRALRPYQAILLSATANFLGALAGTAVATFVAAGIVTLPPGDTGQVIVCAALVGAIAWNLITWRAGIPSSSSHALIGGLIGAAFAGVGSGALNVAGIVGKVLVPLVLSPVLGIAIGFALMVVLLNVFRRSHPRRINEPVPPPPGGIRGVHGLRPWLKRRPEDNGRHDDRARQRRDSRQTRRAGLDHPARRLGDLARYRGGWLADHPNDGPAGREARPGPWVCRRDDRRNDHPRRVAVPASRFRRPT